jgi:hypothetical protein
VRKHLTKSQRQHVYEKYNGHCAYCGCELDIKDMQVDHIKSDYLGGESDMSNYNPACRMCNFYKSTMPIEKFREQIGLLVDRLHEFFIFSLAKKYGLIEIKQKEIKFYFEEEHEKKSQTHRYYLMQRPPGPGCQPNEGIVNIDYTTGRLDGHIVWGSVDYNRKLTPSYRKRVKSKNIKELVLIERR